MNFLPTKILALMLAVAAAPAMLADPAKVPAAKPVAARSVFVQPANPREGRDPFFPDSTRPYEGTSTGKHVDETTPFTFKGISIEHGHAMVIINNHTFGLGDEGDVLTAGGRVHIRLAEIRTNSVVIEANGAKREIMIGKK